MWRQVRDRGVLALCLAILGHLSMDIFTGIPGHSVWSLSFLERTLVDAWGIWVGLEAWQFLIWAAKRVNGKESKI
jgi:hypothetical protein